MLQVKSRLDNEQWIQNLFHQDENLYIGKIFEMIAPAALMAKIAAAQANAKQLPGARSRASSRTRRRRPSRSPRRSAGRRRSSAVRCPELYVRNDVPGALVGGADRVRPHRSRVRRVLTGFTPQELTFIVGKHLSYYRGEHYIKHLFPTVAELTVLLFAGIKIVAARFAGARRRWTQQVNATAAELAKYMQPIQHRRAAARRAEVHRGRRQGEHQALDASASTHGGRAGLLLCAAISRSPKKIIAAEPQAARRPSAAGQAEGADRLLGGEQYFALRKALGIAIG